MVVKMSARITQKLFLYYEDSVGDSTGQYEEGDDVKITLDDGTMFEGTIEDIFNDEVLLMTNEGGEFIDVYDIEDVQRI
jgi:hypothetical protein